MKAELWKEIEDGFLRSKNSTPVNVQMNYCVPDENYPDRFKYHCESKYFICCWDIVLSKLQQNLQNCCIFYSITFDYR